MQVPAPPVQEQRINPGSSCRVLLYTQIWTSPEEEGLGRFYG